MQLKAFVLFFNKLSFKYHNFKNPDESFGKNIVCFSTTLHHFSTKYSISSICLYISVSFFDEIISSSQTLYSGEVSQMMKGKHCGTANVFNLFSDFLLVVQHLI